MKVSWTSDDVEDINSGWEATWNLSYNRKFKFFSNQVSMLDAANHCSALQVDGGGWQLASINSQREDNLVAGLGYNDTWIGLGLIGSQYKWMDGSGFEGNIYSNWWLDTSEGISYFPGNETHETYSNCVVYSRAVIGNRSLFGGWKKMGCAEQLPFICSKR